MEIILLSAEPDKINCIAIISRKIIFAAIKEFQHKCRILNMNSGSAENVSRNGYDCSNKIKEDEII